MTKKKQQKFPIDKLREHCKEIFKVELEVFDGAFYNVEEKEVAKDEAQKKIDAFLKKEVAK